MTNGNRRAARSRQCASVLGAGVQEHRLLRQTRTLWSCIESYVSIGVTYTRQHETPRF